MMAASPMDALSFSLCVDTASLAHRDAIRGERHPPHLHPYLVVIYRRMQNQYTHSYTRFPAGSVRLPVNGGPGETARLDLQTPRA
jgi:hypothetical protein